MEAVQLFPVGDCGLLAVCGDRIDDRVGDRVTALDAAIRAARAALDGVHD